ncbi:hypothetical protein KP509_39G008600 [Ceratopteris richardii]|nr:hypothetical protein KP509_39G008600 [Ceratopteris richardii]
MLDCDVPLHPHAFVDAIKACASSRSLYQGIIMHVLIVESGFESQVHLGTALIDMYTRCNALQDAKNVFGHFTDKNVFLYTALISGLTQQGNVHEAIALFVRMLKEGVKPSNVTYICAIKACSSIKTFDLGRLCHSQIVEEDSYLWMDDVIISNTLLDMYGKCGSVEDARCVFNVMRIRDVITWTTMLEGYSMQASQEEVFYLFQQMQQEGIQAGLVTYIIILSVCFDSQSQTKGKSIHSVLLINPLESNIQVDSTIINMYAKCGNLQEARKSFDRLQVLDVVSWTTMLEAYAEQGDIEEVFVLFTQMQYYSDIEFDKVTFSPLLKVCTKVGACDWGRYVHSWIIERKCELEVVLIGALIDLYSKCGNIEDAHQLFNKMPVKNIITVTTLLNGYTHLGFYEEAFSLYVQLREDGFVPDHIMFNVLTKSCSNDAFEGDDKLMNQQTFEHHDDHNTLFLNKVLTRFITHRKLEDALDIFSQHAGQHKATWSSMIALLCKNNYCYVVLLLFEQMKQQGIKVEAPTYVWALKACTKMAALEQGKFIHVQIDQNLWQADSILGSTLIDMYCKCNCLLTAEVVFNRLVKRDVVAWNSMIAGYAHNNDYRTALIYFKSMQHVGIKPNEVVYISLLSSCSSRGFINEGLHLFQSIELDVLMKPSVGYYHCMVDLCGRNGFLKEANDLLLTMPILPDLAAWMSLLSHSRTFGRVEIATGCYQNIVMLDESHASSYELMSKLYLDVGRVDDANEVQERRKQAHARKKSAVAFIEVNNKVGIFLVGGRDHEQYQEVSCRLQNCYKYMREFGFIPLVDSVLRLNNVENELVLP